MPSTWINGRKRISTLEFLAKSKYGDFGSVGSGCDTNILLIFKVMYFWLFIVSVYVKKLSKLIAIYANLHTIAIGIASTVQRYKNE